MKKLVAIIIVLLLSIIAFFQYKSYTRLNPPNNYFYEPLTDDIDINYHDQKAVADYFQLTYSVSDFAREQWCNHKIDVLFKDESSPQSVEASLVYNQMLVSLKNIEGLLIASAKLKAKGFSNNDIKAIESGVSELELSLSKSLKTMNMKFGDQGDDVLLLQKKLHQLGYELKVDGIFDIETKRVVASFQEKNNLFPNGTADEQTLIKLFIEVKPKK